MVLPGLPGTARAYTPPPPDPPELKALAASLVAAPDDDARDRLLADAPPALRDHPQFGHALNKAWGPMVYAGDYDRAAKLGEYSRRLLSARGDTVQAANALALLASIDGYRGDNQAALGKFTEARGVFEAANDQDKLAMVLANEGLIHFRQGDFQQALADAGRALGLYREMNFKPGIINELNNMGSIFMAEGLTDRALDYRQQALAVAGDDPAWQVDLFHNLANVYTQRSERAKAIEWMSRSVALAETVGDKSALAAGLQELGDLHLQGGQPDTAEGEFRSALKIAEDIGDKRQQAGTLSSLGDLLRRRGDEKSRREALSLAERAVAFARATGEPAYVWRSSTLVGQLHLALHEPDRARAAFEESIAAIEDTRSHLAVDDAGATAFLADKMDAYHGMVALLVQENRPADALAMAERAKARVLIDILNGPKFDPAQSMTAAERAAAKSRQEAIADLNRKLAAARSTDPPAPASLLDDLNGRLAAARRSRDEGEEDFFIAHPELRNRRPPRADAGSLDAALGKLLADGKTALLEYVVSDDETFLFTVTKAKGIAPNAPPVIHAQRLPLGRAALAGRTGEFRAALAERSIEWESGARALGKDLLDPASAACADCERLIIVADGPLWELPFQALTTGVAGADSTPTPALAESYAVSFAPSLTFLAGAAAAPLTQPARLLAVGNPALAERDVAPADPVLAPSEIHPSPNAEKQVRALAELYGAEQSKLLVGTEAHEDAFKRLAGGFDVIHLATHGFLNDTAPMYSRLLMAQTSLAPDEDGLLEAWEWLPLQLHARLAVLSACETGRGRVSGGEGMIGLSWALLRAGCPAVVVSQWKVDSASTTELMIAFHQHLLAGDDPADALRAAGWHWRKIPGTGTRFTGRRSCWSGRAHPSRRAADGCTHPPAGCRNIPWPRNIRRGSASASY